MTTTQRLDADLLIPGKGDPIEKGALVWTGKTINYAGPHKDLPMEYRKLKASRHAVVMPGMWDCHIHFLGAEKLDMMAAAITSQALAGARCVPDLQAPLMAGFTSVREVGGYGAQLASAVDSGKVLGPTIYGSHSAISMTAGHGDVHSMPLDGLSALTAHGVPFTVADGVEGCTRAVRLQLRQGARIIKVCASGGVASEKVNPDHQQFSNEELKAVVDEARRSGRAVAAHCHGKPGVMAALQAGCLTIEHGSFLDDETIDVMLEKGAMLVATRAIIEGLLAMKEHLTPVMREKLLHVADAHSASYKLAVQRGVKIALGTDTFSSPKAGGTFGYGKNGQELLFATLAGLSPLEAIEAATANGPLTLGPQAPLSGQLRKGYDADFIAVESNPLDDISILADSSNVTHIWKGGSSVKSSS
ncbi:hypothetical protein PRZ48_007183 [Zasmidium cellare]|uniref:Amidohydrolase-related domain-containing protein n=1 Tax=Zasmidium cellare TaxID=395010 RepID=A0ABR0EJN1_ZASCE|nr:hypothetical protein PRZ48_007183 [Zasmidium cellare]